MKINHSGFNLATVPILFFAFGASLSAVTTVNYADYVAIGDAGNAADTTGLGAVAYSYHINKYDVTCSQYAVFLNAVDTTGTNSLGLYNFSMGTDLDVAGIGFENSAADGSKYSVIAGQGNKPVVYVSVVDAMRYANWMNNGLGNGGTESGAYDLSQVPTSHDPLIPFGTIHSANSMFWIPTRDEWYKSAFYDPTLNGGGGGYWDYPTRSNTVPTQSASSTTPNTANYYGSPGGLTDVGSYSNSASFYGTFDQGGNVWQWTETPNFSYRYLFGGSWIEPGHFMAAGNFNQYLWHAENQHAGFRLASSVPEPMRLLLMLAGVGGIVMIRRRTALCK